MKGVAKMDEAQSEKKQEIKRILTEEMWPNPDQPRKNSWGDIQGLRTTMDEQGLVQYPVVIPKKQPRGKGKFMIISGERRWRAAKGSKKQKRIPCIIRRDIKDEDIYILSVMENMQRQSLDPIEEATAFKRLIKELNLKSPNALAARLGISAPKIYNALKLLDLPDEIQNKIAQKKISPVSVSGLHSIPDKQTQKKVAQEIIDKKLTGKQSQNLILDTMEKKGGTLSDGRKAKEVRLENHVNVLRRGIESLDEVAVFYQKLSKSDKKKFIELVQEKGADFIEEMMAVNKFLDEVWRIAD